MIQFGGPVERMARVLHEARMQECYGNWQLPSRFRWPETREQWEHYQHNPHSAVLQALAQAKAVLAAKEGGMTNEAKEQAA
jgi:hypothetical protein